VGKRFWWRYRNTESSGDCWTIHKKTSCFKKCLSHGLLPFKHIDHLHPDALISVAAAKDSEAVTKEIWGDTMGWVPWQKPGFDLGLQLEKCLNDNPGIRGIVLGGHGLFTWGDTSYESYI